MAEAKKVPTAITRKRAREEMEWTVRQVMAAEVVLEAVGKAGVAQVAEGLAAAKLVVATTAAA